MAIVECRECKKEVSNQAPTCPHCGVRRPAPPPKMSPIVAIGTLVTIFGLIYSFSTGTTNKESAAPAVPAETPEQIKAREAAEDAKCKTDLQCWFNRQVITGTYPCQKAIEKRAKYSVRWNDGALEMKFSRATWSDKEKGIINMIGDKVEFQNGFGAWGPMIYACTYDPNSQSVVDVLMKEGRL